MRAAAVVLMVLAAAAGASAAPVLPDLVSDPPVHAHVESRAAGAGEPARLLLRMDGFVHNAGAGPLDVAGNPSAGTVTQRVLQAPGNTFLAGRPLTLQFENSDGHNHWHMMAAAEYSLWNLAQSAQVAPADKIGFCLYDIERIETTGPASAFYDGGVNANFCEADNPGATAIRMGISSGWRDTYGWFLELQWVDVSDTPPGEYRLAARVDPDDAVAEANEVNARAFATATSIVPGYVAAPVGPIGVAPGAPAQVTLAASTFSRTAEAGATPGPRRFVVVTPPQHGDLTVATGAAFVGPVVTYTPDPGYTGTDAFSYVARDLNSPFPRTPQAAAVSLNVGSAQPAIALSGAPARLVAGTAVQLTAAVTNAAPDLEWTVGGIVGGTPALGTVTANGLYRAPATVPAAPVTVGVRLRTQPAVAATAAITIVPVPAPTPRPSPTPASGREPTPNTPVRAAAPVVRDGRLLLRAVAPATGTLRLQARQANGLLLVECVMPVRKGRVLTCSRRISSAWNLRSVTARAGFVDPARTIPALTRPGVAIRNGFLMVRSTARRGGDVELILTRAGARLLRCAARVPAGRPVACSRRVGPAVRAAQVQAVVTHRSARGVAVTRL